MFFYIKFFDDFFFFGQFNWFFLHIDDLIEQETQPQSVLLLTLSKRKFKIIMLRSTLGLTEQRCEDVKSLSK